MGTVDPCPRALYDLCALSVYTLSSVRTRVHPSSVYLGPDDAGPPQCHVEEVFPGEDAVPTHDLDDELEYGPEFN